MRQLRKRILALGLLATACAVRPGPAPHHQALPASAPGFTILAINDVYRIEGVEGGAEGGLARVRTLRRQLEKSGEEVLLLHAGDLLYPSLLSRRYDGEQMIDVLNLLDGDPEAFDERMFVTFGNHEFDRARLEDAARLDRRLEESQFTWLGTNLRFAADARGVPLIAAESLHRTRLVTVNGVRVGLFSVTTSEAAAAYVDSFGEPVRTAREATAALRADGAEVIVALTHLALSEDLEILERLGEDAPDLLIGGHEHVAQAAELSGRWVLKADAEARSAVVARVTPAPAGPPFVRHQVVPLAGRRPQPDPVVRHYVRRWQERFEAETCEELGEPSGCLRRRLGTTRVRLQAEELTIRRWESNFGNWIADRMVEAFAGQGAQAAFINSGSLRLNQDLPANSTVSRRHLEELFAYPAGLVLLRLDAETLKQVLTRSVETWTGNGWWLQVSGLAFRHDPATASASDLTLVGPQGPRPLQPGEELLVVTNRFLVEPAGGQDGYTMLSREQVVADGGDDLKDLVARALVAAGPRGIAPRVEGRICNPLRSGPCLAVSP